MVESNTPVAEQQALPKEEPKLYDYFTLRTQGFNNSDIAMVLNDNSYRDINSDVAFPKNPDKAKEAYMSNPNIPKEKKTDDEFQKAYDATGKEYADFKQKQNEYAKVQFVPRSPVPSFGFLPKDYIPPDGFQRAKPYDLGVIPDPDPVFFRTTGGFKQQQAEYKAAALQNGWYMENGQKKDLAEFKNDSNPFSWLITALEGTFAAITTDDSLSNKLYKERMENKKLVMKYDEKGQPYFESIPMGAYAKQSDITTNINDQRSLETSAVNDGLGAFYNTVWNSFPGMFASGNELIDITKGVFQGKSQQDIDTENHPFTNMMNAYAASEQYNRGLINDEKPAMSWGNLPTILGSVAGSLVQYFTGSKGLSLLGASAKTAFTATSWLMGSQAYDQVRQLGEEKGMTRSEIAPFALGTWVAQSLIELTGQNWLFEKWLTSEEGTQALKLSLKQHLEEAGATEVMKEGGNNAFLGGFKVMTGFIKKITGKEINPEKLSAMLGKIQSGTPTFMKPMIEEGREETFQQMSQNLFQVLHDSLNDNTPQFYDDSNQGGISELWNKGKDHIFDQVPENALGGVLGGMWGGIMMPKAVAQSHLIDQAIMTGQGQKLRDLVTASFNDGTLHSDKAKAQQYFDGMMAEINVKEKAFKESGLEKYYNDVVANNSNYNKETGDPEFALKMKAAEETEDGTQPYLHAWMQAANALSLHNNIAPDTFEGGKDAWTAQQVELQKNFERINSDEYKFANYARLGYNFFAREYLKENTTPVKLGYLKAAIANTPTAIQEHLDMMFKIQEQNKEANNRGIDDILGKAFKDNNLDPKFSKQISDLFSSIRTHGASAEKAGQLQGLFNTNFDNHVKALKEKYGLQDSTHEDVINNLSSKEGIPTVTEDENGIPTVSKDEAGNILYDKKFDPADKALATALGSVNSDVTYTDKFDGQPKTDAEINDLMYNKTINPISGAFESFDKVIADIEAAIETNPGAAKYLDMVINDVADKKQLAFFSDRLQKNFSPELFEKGMGYNSKSTFKGNADEYIKNLDDVKSKLDAMLAKNGNVLTDATSKYNIDQSLHHAKMQHLALNELAQRLTGEEIKDKTKRARHIELINKIKDQLKDAGILLKATTTNWETSISKLDNNSYAQIKSDIDKARLIVVSAATNMHEVLKSFKTDAIATEIKGAVIEGYNKIATTKLTDANNTKDFVYDCFKNQANVTGIQSTDFIPILSPVNKDSQIGPHAYLAFMTNYLNNIRRVNPHEFYTVHKQINDMMFKLNKNAFIDDPEQEEMLFHAYAFMVDNSHVFKSKNGPDKLTSTNIQERHTAYKNILNILGRAGTGKTFSTTMLSAMIMHRAKALAGTPIKSIMVVAPSEEQLTKLHNSVIEASKISGESPEITPFTNKQFEEYLRKGKDSQTVDFVLMDETTNFSSVDINALIQKRINGTVFQIGDSFQYNSVKTTKDEESFKNTFPVTQTLTEKTIPLIGSKRISDPTIESFNVTWLQICSSKQVRNFGTLIYNQSRTEGVYAAYDVENNKALQITNFANELMAGNSPNTFFVVDTPEERQDVINEIESAITMASVKGVDLKLIENSVLQLTDNKARFAQGLEKPKVYIRFSKDRSQLNNDMDAVQYKLWYTAVSRAASFIDILMPSGTAFKATQSNDNNDAIHSYLNKLEQRNVANSQMQRDWFNTVYNKLNKDNGLINQVSSTEKPGTKTKSQEVTEREADDVFTEDTADDVSKNTAEETHKVNLMNAAKTVMNIAPEIYNAPANPEEDSFPADAAINEVEQPTEKGKSIYEMFNALGDPIMFRNVYEWAKGFKRIKFLDTHWLADNSRNKNRQLEFGEGRRHDIIQRFMDSFPTWTADFRKNGIVRKTVKLAKGEYRIGYYLNPDHPVNNAFLSDIAKDDYYKGGIPQEHLLVGYEYLPDVFQMGTGINLFNNWNEIEALAKASGYNADVFFQKLPSTKFVPNYADYIVDKLGNSAIDVLSYEKAKIQTWLEAMYNHAQDSELKSSVSLNQSLRAPNVKFSDSYKPLSEFLTDNFQKDKNGALLTFRTAKQTWFKSSTGYYMGKPVFLNKTADATLGFYEQDDSETETTGRVAGFDKRGFEAGWYVPVTWSITGLNPKSIWVKLKGERFTESKHYDEFGSFIKELQSATWDFYDKNNSGESYMNMFNYNFMSSLLTYSKHFWTDKVGGKTVVKPEFEKFIEIKSKPGAKEWLRLKYDNSDKGNIKKDKDFISKFVTATKKYGNSEKGKKNPLYGMNTLMHLVNQLGAHNMPNLNLSKNKGVVDFDSMNNEFKRVNGTNPSSPTGYDILNINIDDVLTNSFVVNREQEKPVANTATQVTPENANSKAKDIYKFASTTWGSDLQTEFNKKFNQNITSWNKSETPKEIERIINDYYSNLNNPSDPLKDFNFNENIGQEYEPANIDEIGRWFHTMNPWMQVNANPNLMSDVNAWGKIQNSARKFMAAKFGNQVVSLFAENGIAFGGFSTAAHEFSHSIWNSLRPSVRESLLPQIYQLIADKENIPVSWLKNKYDDHGIVEKLMDHIGDNLLLKDGKPVIKEAQSFFGKMGDMLKSFIDQILNFLGLSRNYNQLDKFFSDIQADRFNYTLMSYAGNGVDYNRNTTTPKGDEKTHRDLLDLFSSNSSLRRAVDSLKRSVGQLSVFNGGELTMAEATAAVYDAIQNAGADAGKSVVRLARIKSGKRTVINKTVAEMTPSDFDYMMKQMRYGGEEVSIADAQRYAKQYLYYNLSQNPVLMNRFFRQAFNDVSIKEIRNFNQENGTQDSFESTTEQIRDDEERTEDESVTEIETELSDLPNNVLLDRAIEGQPFSLRTFMYNAIANLPIYATTHDQDGNFTGFDTSKPLPSIPADSVFHFLINAYHSNPEIENSGGFDHLTGSFSGEQVLERILQSEQASGNELMNSHLRALYARFYHVPQMINTGGILHYAPDAITGIYNLSIKATLSNPQAASIFQNKEGRPGEDVVLKQKAEYIKLNAAFMSEIANHAVQNMSTIVWTGNYARFQASDNIRNLDTFGRIKQSLGLLGAIRSVETPDGDQNIYTTNQEVINQFNPTSTWQVKNDSDPIIRRLMKLEGGSLTKITEASREAAIQLLTNIPNKNEIFKKGRTKVSILNDEQIADWFNNNFIEIKDSRKDSKFNFTDKGIYKGNDLILSWNNTQKEAAFKIPANQINDQAYKLQIARELLNSLKLNRGVISDRVLTYILSNQSLSDRGENDLRTFLGNKGMKKFGFGEKRLATLLYQMVRSIVKPDESEDILNEGDLADVSSIFIDKGQSEEDVRGIVKRAMGTKALNRSEEEGLVFQGLDALPEDSRVAHPMAHRTDLSDLASIVTYIEPLDAQKFLLNAKGTREYLLQYKGFLQNKGAMDAMYGHEVLTNPNSPYKFNSLINGTTKTEGVSKMFNVKMAKTKAIGDLTISDLAKVYADTYVGSVLKDQNMYVLPIFIPGKSSRVYASVVRYINQDYRLVNIDENKIVSLHSKGLVNHIEDSFKQMDATRINETAKFRQGLEAALGNLLSGTLLSKYNKAWDHFNKTGDITEVDTFINKTLEGNKQTTDASRMAVYTSLRDHLTAAKPLGRNITLVDSMLQEYRHYHKVPVLDSQGAVRYYRIFAGNYVASHERVFNAAKNAFDIGENMFSLKNKLAYDAKKVELQKEYSDPKKQFKLHDALAIYLKNDLFNQWYLSQIYGLRLMGLAYNSKAAKMYSYGNDLENDYWWKKDQLEISPEKRKSNTTITLDGGRSEDYVHGLGVSTVITNEAVRTSESKRKNVRKLQVMHIHPAYDALIWQTAMNTWNNLLLYGHDPMNSKNSEIGAARNKAASISGGTPAIGKFNMAPTLLTVTVDGIGYKNLIGDSSDGASIMTDVGAAMMSLGGFGAEYSTVADNYEGSAKMGLFSKKADGTDIYLKGASTIISKDIYENNDEMLPAVQRMYSIQPIVDHDGSQKFVWDIYQRNGMDPRKTALELIELQENNPNMGDAFVFSLEKPSTIKTSKTTPVTTLADIGSGAPMYAARVKTNEYRNLAKLNNDVNAMVTNNNQFLNSMMFGIHNYQQSVDGQPSLAQRMNDSLIEHIQTGIAVLHNEIAKAGGDETEYLRTTAVNALSQSGDAGAMMDMLTNRNISLNISAPHKYLGPVIKSHFKDLANPKVSGARVTQTPSTLFNKTFYDRASGTWLTLRTLNWHLEHNTGAYDITQLEQNNGFPYMTWQDGNRTVISDTDIVNKTPFELQELLKSNPNAVLKASPVAYAFDFWQEMGYNNQEGHIFNYRNYNVPEIESLMVDGKLVRFETLGNTAKERKAAFVELYNTVQNKDAFVSDTHAFVKVLHNYELTGRDLADISIDELVNVTADWLNRFENGLVRIISRTPFQTTAMGAITRIVDFTNNSGNNLYISPMFQVVANSDYDGDQLTMMRAYPESVIPEDIYSTKRFNEAHEFYSNPLNAGFYLEPVTTNLTKSAINIAFHASKNENPEVRQKINDLMSQLKTYENNHYADSLIGMMANILKMYSMLYYVNPSFNWVYDGKVYTSFRGYEGDMQYEGVGTNKSILSHLADYMQAILDHEKNQLVDKIEMNEITINAQAAMLLAGINPDSVFALFNHPSTKELLSSSYKSGDASNYYSADRPYVTLQNMPKILDSVQKQYNDFKALFIQGNNNQREFDKQIKDFNLDMFQLELQTGLKFPYINSNYDTLDPKRVDLLSTNVHHGSLQNFEEKLLSYKSILPQLTDVFFHGEAVNQLAGNMRLTTKFLPGNEYKELKYFDNQEAISLDPTFADRFEDNSMKPISINGKILELPSTLEDGTKMNITFGISPKKAFQNMNDVAKSFIDPADILHSVTHYIGDNGIMNLIHNEYLPLMERNIIYRAPEFQQAMKQALNNLGYSTLPGPAAWTEIMDSLDYYMISDWIAGQPLRDQDWGYDSLITSSKDAPENNLENKKDILHFINDTIDFISKLQGAPEELGLSAEQIKLLDNNAFIKLIEVKAYNDNVKLQLIPIAEFSSKDKLADIQNSLYELERIVLPKNDTKNHPLVNRLYLYTMLTNRFGLQKGSLLRALPSDGVTALENYSKYMDRQLQTLKDGSFTDKERMNELFQRATLNAFAQSYDKNLRQSNYVRYDKLNYADAVKNPKTTDAGYHFKSDFILDVDLEKMANAPFEEKWRGIGEKLIPMNREVVTKKYGATVADDIFKYRKSIPLEELPTIIKIKYSNGKSKGMNWLMRYNPEEGNYTRVWSTHSLVAAMANTEVDPFSDQATIKPGLKSLQEYFDTGSAVIKFNKKIYYTNNQSVSIFGDAARVKNVNINDVTVTSEQKNDSFTLNPQTEASVLFNDAEALQKKLTDIYFDLLASVADTYETVEEAKSPNQFNQEVMEQMDIPKETKKYMRENAITNAISRDIYRLLLQGMSPNEIQQTIEHKINCKL